jgi:hypothetical protein
MCVTPFTFAYVSRDSVILTLDVGSSDYFNWFSFYIDQLSISSSRVVVSVLATGPKGCGFKTRPRRWIFKGDKNPQHTSLSDGK